MKLTPEERREIQRPLDLWDTSDHGGELRGAGLLLAVCLFGTVFGLVVPFLVWLYLR